MVVDATGARQALARRGAARGLEGVRPRAEQTAFGVVVPREVAARVSGDRLLFMDWRADHGHEGWPTFLYAVPLDAERVLLEETSLARRPGLPMPELRARLRARLLAAGLTEAEIPDDPADVEKVRFPVDSPRHRSPAGVVAVGAADPLVHPASGFSLATSLRMAPRLATVLADALRGGADPAAAAKAARRVVRSPRRPPCTRCAAGASRPCSRCRPPTSRRSSTASSPSRTSTDGPISTPATTSPHRSRP